jgi:ribonuclease P protein component
LHELQGKFPKTARLLSRSEFQYVFNQPYKNSDYLLVVFTRHNNRSTARLGLAISRKCARRAVDRNRIKRVLRETFRFSLEALPCLDFVVLCRAVAKNASNSALGDSLLALLEKISQRK